MTVVTRSRHVLFVLILMRISAGHAQPPSAFPDGSLHQNDIAVRLQEGNVQLRAIPLSESIIRLLTPESYRALRGTRERFALEIEAAASEWGVLDPTVFLVTAIGTVNDMPFSPDQLTITSRNILRRPIAILPMTPQWSSQRLADREPVSALYVFDGVAVWEAFVMHYGASATDDWARSLRALERERNRVGRGSAGTGPG